MIRCLVTLTVCVCCVVINCLCVTYVRDVALWLLYILWWLSFPALINDFTVYSGQFPMVNILNWNIFVNFKDTKLPAYTVCTIM